MAVEVTEQGAPPEDISQREYEVKCRGCKSWLKFKGSDARPANETEDQRRMPQRLIEVDCPVCAKVVQVTA